MKVKILSTSDVHGYIFPTNFSSRTDYHPFGYLKAAQVIKTIKETAASDEVVIYIENGDFLEGSPMTDYTYRTRKTKKYNQDFCMMTNFLDADAGVLGNHEFDYGISYIEETWKNKKYPILGANISGEMAQKIIDQPYRIIEKAGIKIAILGLTTQYVPHWEKAENIDRITFSSALTAAKKYVPILKKQADVVVVAYHGGFEKDLGSGRLTEELTGENEGYALLCEVPGIDALVTGHQHRKIAQLVNGVPTTQPGYRAENVGQISIELDDNKAIIGSSAELLNTSDQPVNQELEAILMDWRHSIEDWLDIPVATVNGNMHIHNHLNARLHGHAYLDLINHIQMDATGTDVAGSALFNDEVKGYDAQITVRDILNNYIYPNTLVVERISGADLRAALERCASFFELHADGSISMASSCNVSKVQLYNYDYYSGIDYTFDLTKPLGQRVVRVMYHKQVLKDTDKIDVAISQYRAVGGGEYPMFNMDKSIRVCDDDMPKLIAKYLREHKEFKAVQPNNLKIIK
ncbi:bifunctional metallophosphatase/5'-nucleotidase [Lactobacillus sp. UCMA15818]|uniref:bifunctional metallophosphatase/5'-nucleotidase n=1 Tax=Lactobacillaceae TaxID=33958 RepID=UPI0025B03DEE|nr:bifunctional metallophosphatase/5'-nucleotidase [Lactobacillus sp. UCMA15818]MDN2453932.1 bifunctional metallophosphatase/5'-nucleotidase [Lactobacillus sp. UCMA15818]